MTHTLTRRRLVLDSHLRNLLGAPEHYRSQIRSIRREAAKVRTRINAHLPSTKSIQSN